MQREGSLTRDRRGRTAVYSKRATKALWFAEFDIKTKTLTTKHRRYTPSPVLSTPTPTYPATPQTAPKQVQLQPGEPKTCRAPVTEGKPEVGNVLLICLAYVLMDFYTYGVVPYWRPDGFLLLYFYFYTVVTQRPALSQRGSADDHYW